MFKVRGIDSIDVPESTKIAARYGCTVTVLNDRGPNGWSDIEVSGPNETDVWCALSDLGYDHEDIPDLLIVRE